MSFASTFRGLADPVRRRILESLSVGGRSVAELAGGFPISRPAISKHLRVLKECGLVVEHKRGRRRIYELVGEPLDRVVDWAASLAGSAAVVRGLPDGPSAPAVVRAGSGVAARRGKPSADEPAGEREWRSW